MRPFRNADGFQPMGQQHWIAPGASPRNGTPRYPSLWDNRPSPQAPQYGQQQPQMSSFRAPNTVLGNGRFPRPRAIVSSQFGVSNGRPVGPRPNAFVPKSNPAYGGGPPKSNPAYGGGPIRPKVTAAVTKPEPAKTSKDVNKEGKNLFPAPAPATTVPGTLADLNRRVSELEKSFVLFRETHGQVHKLMGDVEKIKNEIFQSKDQTYLKRAATSDEEIIPSKMLKFENEGSCIISYPASESVFVPVNDSEGHLIVTGKKAYTITPDQYYVLTRSKVTFAGMVTTKVNCEIAHITYEDGKLEDHVLAVWEGTEKDHLAPTMSKLGMEARIRIDSPEKAAMKCFRKKDVDWFDLEPCNFFLNGVRVTNFANVPEKEHMKFYPDLDALYKENKFTCKLAWNRANFPFVRPIETGSLVECRFERTVGKSNVKVISGKYKGCYALLSPELVGQFSTKDILRCDLQIGVDSSLDALNPVLVPTKKN